MLLIAGTGHRRKESLKTLCEVVNGEGTAGLEMLIGVYLDISSLLDRDCSIVGMLLREEL